MFCKFRMALFLRYSFICMRTQNGESNSSFVYFSYMHIVLDLPTMIVLLKLPRLPSYLEMHLAAPQRLPLSHMSPATISFPTLYRLMPRARTPALE